MLIGIIPDARREGRSSERADVEQLADAAGAKLDEALERGEFLDLEDLPDIEFFQFV